MEAGYTISAVFEKLRIFILNSSPRFLQEAFLQPRPICEYLKIGTRYYLIFANTIQQVDSQKVNVAAKFAYRQSDEVLYVPGEVDLTNVAGERWDKEISFELGLLGFEFGAATLTLATLMLAGADGLLGGLLFGIELGDDGGELDDAMKSLECVSF